MEITTNPSKNPPLEQNNVLSRQNSVTPCSDTPNSGSEENGQSMVPKVFTKPKSQKDDDKKRRSVRLLSLSSATNSTTPTIANKKNNQTAKKTNKTQPNFNPKTTCFPVLLHRMLCDLHKTHPEVAHWHNSNNRLFRIVNDKNFAKVVRPYFEHGRFDSVRRQLSAYGFKKQEGKYTEYYGHPVFAYNSTKQSLEEINTSRSRKNRKKYASARKRKKAATLANFGPNQVPPKAQRTTRSQEGNAPPVTYSDLYDSDDLVKGEAALDAAEKELAIQSAKTAPNVFHPTTEQLEMKKNMDGAFDVLCGKEKEDEASCIKLLESPVLTYSRSGKHYNDGNVVRSDREDVMAMASEALAESLANKCRKTTNATKPSLATMPIRAKISTPGSTKTVAAVEDCLPRPSPFSGTPMVGGTIINRGVFADGADDSLVGWLDNVEPASPIRQTDRSDFSPSTPIELHYSQGLHSPLISEEISNLLSPHTFKGPPMDVPSPRVFDLESALEDCDKIVR